MKLLVSLISGCVLVGGLLSLARNPVRPQPLTPMTAPATPLTRVTTRPMLYARALQGVPVRTPDGMQLGTLDDLVLDPTDARIIMVIVVAGGRFGFGGRFIALPWGLVQPVADGTALVVTLVPTSLHPPPDQEGLEAVFPQ
jgi:sporulation protein YlmC with PRC-barrel domain